jgi:hypothetical protein
MFRHVARLLAVALLLGAGCEDATFDLLPAKPKAAGAGGGAGEAVGAAGESAAMGGSRAGTAGSASGRGGFGNMAGRGGASNGGTGGASCVGSDCCGQNGVQCGDCNQDADCSMPTPFCENFRCVWCRAYPECNSQTEDCGCEETQICDGAFNVCFTRCSDESECSNGLHCDPVRMYCVPCVTSEDCRNNVKYKVCAPSLGYCVDCLRSGDCKDPNDPICSDHTCRPCFSNNECSSKLCAGGRCVTNTDTPQP